MLSLAKVAILADMSILFMFHFGVVVIATY